MPTCESLETKALLAAPYINVVSGVLQIVGDSSVNKAVVNVSGSNIKVTMSSTPTDGFYLVDPTTTITKTFAASTIHEIKFWGYENDDSFINNWNIKAMAYGGPGNDYLEGSNADDTFYGGTGNDTLIGYSGHNVLNGETGTDKATGNALDQMPNCEAVNIKNLPGGNVQSKNKCGPNSAWRVIKALGGTATVQEVTDRASEQSLVSRWNLGTTGSTLVGAMNSLRRGLSGQPNFSLKTHDSKESIFSYLQQGRPVVAMISVSGSESLKIGPISYTVPALHWIAVDGFDSTAQKAFFTDTDGKHYSYSFASFDSIFHWNFGTLQNKAFQALGVVEGTFIA
jgi:RTX calcium-binding nonapeptide repeat (4 copies)/Peptidase_C39 like family